MDRPLPKSDEFAQNKHELMRALAHEFRCEVKDLAVDPAITERMRGHFNAMRYAKQNDEHGKAVDNLARPIGSNREQALNAISSWFEEKGTPLSDERREMIGNLMDALLDQFATCLEWNRRAEDMFNRSKLDSRTAQRHYDRQKDAIEVIRLQTVPYYVLRSIETFDCDKAEACKIIGRTIGKICDTMQRDVDENPAARGSRINPEVPSGTAPDEMISRVVSKARYDFKMIPPAPAKQSK